MSLLQVNDKPKTVLETLFIASTPLTGKTEALMKLPNSVLIDFDGTANTFVGRFYSIKQIAESMTTPEKKVGPITALKAVIKEIIDLKAAGKGFDYVILDSITALSKALEPVATAEFKKGDSGKSFSGSNAVLQAGWGNGEKFLEAEFNKIMPELMKLPNKTLIITGHTKYDAISGPDVEFSDIELPKRLRGSLLYYLNAIGVMYRSDTGVNTLTFKTGKGDQALGARPPHLSNKEFVISEQHFDAEGNPSLKTYWDRVFLELPSSGASKPKPKPAVAQEAKEPIITN